MPIDLFEEKNIPKVVNYLLGFEAAARKSGFSIQLKRLDDSFYKSDRFTAAQMSKAQEALKKTKMENLSVLFHNKPKEVEEIEILGNGDWVLLVMIFFCRGR